MNKLPLGTSHIRYVFRAYKKNAQRRGISFALSMAEFRSIVVLNCIYCGAAPTIGFSSLKVAIPLNGIDRVDSQVGYSLDNCVPACTSCNKLKSNGSREDFLNHIRKIYGHQESV